MIQAVIRTLRRQMEPLRRAINSCDADIAITERELAEKRAERAKYAAELEAHGRIAAGLEAMAGESVDAPAA